MDLPIVIVLLLFAAAAIVLALMYRKQFAEQIEDLLDGEENKTAAQPPPERRDEQESPTPEPEAPRQSQQSEPPDMAGTEPDELELERDEVVPAPEPLPPAKPVQTVPQPAPASPTRGGEVSPVPVVPPVSTALVPDAVKFSAYYPRETAPQVWQTLAAYIFRQSAAADVTKDVGNVLGARASEFRRTDDMSRVIVNEGAMVTAVPSLPGFQVNPPQITLGFYESFHRFDFKVRATSAPVDQAVNGKLTFTVEGVIVSELPLSIFVGHSVGEALTGAITRPVYQAIFCSYSHKDAHIVERVEKAYKALGLTYLRDITTLRSGQDWNDELMRLIDKADIFQLFWSEAASQSQFVRQEWEYALKMKREIRPVYWAQPMAPVPDALNAIHFAYMPDLVQ